MPNSSLSFASTSSFRDVLMAKNLAPYNVVGVYSPQVGNLTYETVLNVSNVIDSPNDLIANDPFANKLYPLNEYGPTGGYDLNINYKYNICSRAWVWNSLIGFSSNSLVFL